MSSPSNPTPSLGVGKSVFTVIDGVLLSLTVKSTVTFVVSICDRLAVWIASFRHRHLSEEGEPSPDYLAQLFDTFAQEFERGGQNVCLKRAQGMTSDAVVTVTFVQGGVEHKVECTLHPCPALERDGLVWKTLCDMYRSLQQAQLVAHSYTQKPPPSRKKETRLEAVVRKPRVFMGSTVVNPRNITKPAVIAPLNTTPWRHCNQPRPNLVSRENASRSLERFESLPSPKSHHQGGGNHAASSSPQQDVLTLSQRAHQWPSVLVDTRQSLQRQLLQSQLEVIKLQSQLSAFLPPPSSAGAPAQIASSGDVASVVPPAVPPPDPGIEGLPYVSGTGGVLSLPGLGPTTRRICGQSRGGPKEVPAQQHVAPPPPPSIAESQLLSITNE